MVGFLANPFDPNANTSTSQKVNATGFLSDPNTPFKNFASQSLQQGQQASQQPFNYNNLGAAPVQTDFTQARKDTISNLNNYYKKNLDERFAKDRQAFDQRMANRGLDIGNELYKRELQAFEDNRARAYADAEHNAFEQGGAEQSRLFNLGLQARQQGVSEANTLRTQPLQEAVALAGAASPYASMGSSEAMQQAGFGFQRGENLQDRQLQTQLQSSQQGFQGRENEADRSLQRGESMADRQLQTSLQTSQLGHEKAENALTRALQEKLGTADKGLIQTILAALGIGGGSSGSRPNGGGGSTTGGGGTKWDPVNGGDGGSSGGGTGGGGTGGGGTTTPTLPPKQSGSTPADPNTKLPPTTVDGNTLKTGGRQVSIPGTNTWGYLYQGNVYSPEGVLVGPGSDFGFK